MKIFYQPGGEKGIIRWSLLLILLMLGIIIQMEIFSENYISPIIFVVAIVTIGLFIIKSYIEINTTNIVIHSVLKSKNRKIDFNKIKSIDYGKYFLVINFKSSEFFPLRIIALPKDIKKISVLLKNNE